MPDSLTTRLTAAVATHFGPADVDVDALEKCPCRAKCRALLESDGYWCQWDERGVEGVRDE